MQVGLRHFDSRTLDWLAVALRSGEHTRHALARELCERTGWLNAPGRPRLSAAAAALPALAKRIGTELPPARDVPDPAAAPAVPAGDVLDARLACALEDLGPASLDLMGDAGDRHLWVAKMEAHHALGWARPPGGQVPATGSARSATASSEGSASGPRRGSSGRATSGSDGLPTPAL